MSNRPTYSRWTRRTGGRKVCTRRSCRHAHAEVVYVDGKATRPKACIKCGAELPSKLTYPARSQRKWYVRERYPHTGATKDHPARSREHADELIRELERTWTDSPVRARFIDGIIAHCHEVKGRTIDELTDNLIRTLGGDPTRKNLVEIGWDEAIDSVCVAMRQQGLSSIYTDDVRRVSRNLRAISGLDNWADFTLAIWQEYRRKRMAGGWKLEGRVVPAIGARAMNKELGTLSAFLSRAKRNNWIPTNPLIGDNSGAERAKTRKARVPYLPDEVLHACIGAASPRWMQVMIIVAYYTGARKPDLLALEWDRDVDLTGDKVKPEGLVGPHIWIDGNKSDSPHWVPLPQSATVALSALRQEPSIDRMVFPVRGIRHKGQEISRLWAVARDKAMGSLPEQLRTTPNGDPWLFKHLRKKANTDLRNLGASSKERMAVLGHSSSDINEQHYEGLQPERLRKIADGLPAFNLTA
jgi:integrase